MPFKEKILIVSDFDGSFYNKQLYQNQIRTSKGKEYELIARLNTSLGNKAEDVKKTIIAQAQTLKITSSQVVLSVLTHEQWVTARLLTTWYNELDLIDLLKVKDRMPGNCRLAIASHTPSQIVSFAFKHKANFPIYGPAELGSYKPNLNFFRAVAELEDVPVSQCIYIGDKPEYDIYPAQKAGYMGAILVPNQALRAIQRLSSLAKKENIISSFKELIKDG